MCGFLLRQVFFAWETSWGKALMLDQLQRRGSNRCFLCHVQESTQHILLHCHKAWILWQLLLSLFGVSWVLPFSVTETLLEWSGSFIGRKQKKVWGAAPLCLFWTIWKEGNRRSFDNEEFSDQRLKPVFLSNFLSSSNLYIVEGPMSLLTFVNWLGFYSRRELFFIFPCPFLLPWATVVYVLCTLVCPFWHFINIFISFYQ